MVPTFGAEPVMGTNPLAFAAPARRNPPFQLDMATTTVAAGKVKVYKLNHKPLPSGWVVDADGQTVTEPRGGVRLRLRAAGGRHHAARRRAGGGRPQGLRARGDGAHPRRRAVRRLLLADRNLTQRPSDPHNIGHFFLAIDPRAFRAEGEFEEDLDQVIDVLHKAPRLRSRRSPVLVAGDPEMATRQERLADGVPVPDDLMEQLRAVAEAADVAFVLAG